MGACWLQGFFIARPMPVEAVAPWVGGGPGGERGRGGGVGPEVRVKRGRGEVSRASSQAPAVKTASDPVRLSPRQLEVMQLLSEGCAVKEIAYRLNIGISTVKVHLSLAYSALRSHNRIEAIRRAAPMLISR